MEFSQIRFPRSPLANLPWVCFDLLNYMTGQPIPVVEKPELPIPDIIYDEYHNKVEQKLEKYHATLGNLFDKYERAFKILCQNRHQNLKFSQYSITEASFRAN